MVEATLTLPEQMALKRALMPQKRDPALDDPTLDTATKEEIRTTAEKEEQAETYSLLVVAEMIDRAIKDVSARTSKAFSDAAAVTVEVAPEVVKVAAKAAPVAGALVAAGALSSAVAGRSLLEAIHDAGKFTLGRTQDTILPAGTEKDMIPELRPFFSPANQTPSGSEQVLAIL